MYRKFFNKNYIVVNQSGQALLFVIVSLTVALAIVTSISLRNLSSISRISQTDTSYRVTAVAEGGAERYLGLNDTQLGALTSNPDLSKCQQAGSDAGFVGSGRNACTLSFTGTGSDNIDATAYVKVANYPNGSDFTVKVKKDEVYELNLNGYSGGNIQMYWRATDGGSTQPAIYVLGYGNSGNSPLIKSLYCPYTGCGVFSTVGGSVTATNSGTESVITLNGLNNVVGLRVRVVGADADVRFAAGAALPYQGYMIESTGELSSSSNVSATKIVTVFRSYNFLPAMFDFAVFNNGAQIQ